MKILTAALLGLVQGLTEFLPVSSSGHLVLAQKFFPAFSQPGVLFDVVLHAGTLLAVLVYFWSDLWRLKGRDLMLLAVGTIPAGLVGFALSDFIETLFLLPAMVALALLVTGVMNLVVDRLKPRKEEFKIADALIVGLFQALAITPGISRSGATIFAATTRGVRREAAARFSFLLSVPAVAGATLLQFLKHGLGNGDLSLGAYLTGFVVAGVSGYLAIKLVFELLTTRNFKIFGIYCLSLGVLAGIVLLR